MSKNREIIQLIKYIHIMEYDVTIKVLRQDS